MEFKPLDALYFMPESMQKMLRGIRVEEEWTGGRATHIYLPGLGVLTFPHHKRDTVFFQMAGEGGRTYCDVKGIVENPDGVVEAVRRSYRVRGEVDVPPDLLQKIEAYRRARNELHDLNASFRRQLGLPSSGGLE